MENEAIVQDKRRLRSIITKGKILKAAKEVFLQEGFQKTSISQIIKKTDVGYGTAYVHFNGKDDMLVVLMEDIMSQFYQIAEMAFSPKSKTEAVEIIEKQTYSFLMLASKERDILRIFEQAIGFSTLAADKWTEIREKFIQHILHDIHYSHQNGLVKENLNYELVARGWFFTNEMYLWEIVKGTEKSSVEEIAKTITYIYTAGLYI